MLSNMFDMFFLTVSSSSVVVGKTLFSRHGGVPSGITCTSLIDSQCMQLIFYLAAAHMYGYDLMPTEYYGIAWTYSTGDDNIVSSSDPLITGQVVADFATDLLLMECTDSTKAAKVTVKVLSEIYYALRRFTPIKGHTNLYTVALKIESISSALCWSKMTDPTIITEVVKNVLNETALHSREDYEKLCCMIQTSGLPINPMPHSQFMADLASQVLTAASKHDIKTTDTVFVSADSELPKTVAKTRDLSRYRKDRIVREMEATMSGKTRVHRFQQLLDTKPNLAPLLRSTDFCNMLDASPRGERSWVESAQVPAHIYSAMMWVNMAKHVAYDPIQGFLILAHQKCRPCSFHGGTALVFPRLICNL